MHTFLYELYRKKSSSRETTATLASHMASINDIFKRYNTVNLLPTSSHNYLINTAQLCMQSVHQNSLHYVHTEGLSPVLPYGAMACRRVHLHVCPCSFMYMRWGIWKELLVDFFFFLSLWVTPETSDLMNLPFTPSRLFFPTFSPSLTTDFNTSHSYSLQRWKICLQVPTFGPTLNNDLNPLSFSPHRIKRESLLGCFYVRRNCRMCTAGK